VVMEEENSTGGLGPARETGGRMECRFEEEDMVVVVVVVVVGGLRSRGFWKQLGVHGGRALLVGKREWDGRVVEGEQDG